MTAHTDRDHPFNGQPPSFMTKDFYLTMAGMAAIASGTTDANLSEISSTCIQPSQDLFAKLSRELLNEILELALVPGHIEISRKRTYVKCSLEYSTSKNSKKLVHHIKAHQAHPVSEDDLTGLSLAKLGQELGAGILRANRMIGGIALRLLYGSNEFHFTDEKAFLLFCDLGPSARNLTTRLNIRIANIKRLDLLYLSGNDIMKSLKLTLSRRGKTGIATVADIWSAISGYVDIGDPQEQKQRFDLIKFEIEGRSVISPGATYRPGLNDADHASSKQDLLFAWGSKLDSRCQCRYPFMPRDLTWMLEEQ